ncbi:hypothetical protein RD792_011016 [Penstemon davidsonii]|uniref:Trichome birefringence-like N-terminal domain-containing protein n=1 Tax=Penstemon davidsonii TaxID=160366 RepID=A0ABR0D453_9LAMI|nr:hypothetical protein RD792_011016 [Penstemon davidsonii]
MKEYNATIEFHWSPMLVESNCDNPVRQDARNRTVRIESIEKHAKQWTDADILVFDSYTWWMVDQTITFLWGSFGSLDAIYKNVTMWLRPFEMAIQTWSNWIEININRDKTKLFFMSMSSDHYRGEEWGAEYGQNCYGETNPILKKEKNWGKLIDREMMEIVESAIDKLGTRGVKVQYLNITYLSAYRKEAHPTIYRTFQVPPKNHRQNQRETNEEEHTTSSKNSCNLFSGKWVYDNESYPLYKEQECSFMPDDLTCEQNGRKDLKYQFWRWQPHHCDLPRFNVTAFLEKVRGKRVVFVGDSLNRNQWLSMMCLLEPAIPPSSKLLIKYYEYTIPIPEYNTTFEFYWSPMLVETNCDNPSHYNPQNRTVRISAIEKHAKHWTDADILVFDSYAWWMVNKTMTLLWGSFDSLDAIYQNASTGVRPYEMALQTWSNWLEYNLNRDKTKLFFMSMSPDHTRGEEWGFEKGQNCYGETEQFMEERRWGTLINREMMEIVESAIYELDKRGVKVQYINITHLSTYRKDAHPSIYKKFPVTPTKEKLANPPTYSDCLHWCLPGVPDVWNQMLYSYIVNS